MKQVWKCDFCSTTDGDQEVIAKHEVGCSFNPLNRKCVICTHHDTDTYGTESCEKHEAGFFFDVADGGVSCPDWSVG